MANNKSANLTIGSVEAFLVALADSVHQAQRQLSQRSIALQPGQPAITYQLPKVEFEFRTSFELGTGDSTLRMRPAGGGGGSQSTSMIKGSFVAVPAQGGKPPPVMTLVLTRYDRELDIQAVIKSADGEALEKVQVEFNIDPAESSPGLSRNTQILPASLLTTKNGTAATTLTVGPDEKRDQLVVVKVDALSETQTVIFKVEVDPDNTETES